MTRTPSTARRWLTASVTAARTVRGEPHAQALVGRLDHWTGRHNRIIVTVAAGATGLYLLIAGLANLS